jgi:RNA polymerase sigma-70 factor (ECF subfamily)
MQRARETVDTRLPQESQQATLRALGDDRLRELVDSFMDAMERDDVDAVVAMLAEDAAWSMPPLPLWYLGHEQLAAFLAGGPLRGEFRWRHLPTSANGQPAVGAYTWHPEEEAYLPFALNVLSVRGVRIQEVTSFIARPSGDRDPEVLARWPDHPPDPSKVVEFFECFGLPTRLDRNHKGGTHVREHQGVQRFRRGRRAEGA